MSLWVDQDMTIKNCVNSSNGFDRAGGFRFGPSAKIVVPAGKTLTIDNSYLSACEGEMWKGIEVMPLGKLITKGNTIIADAAVAVKANYNLTNGLTGDIDLKNTRFYRNQLAVVIGGGANYAGKVNGSIFRYDDTEPLMNFMLPPLCGNHPSYGIGAFNLTDSYWNISDYPDGAANTFEGLNGGIFAFRSNVLVNSNSFKNIRNYNNLGFFRGKAVSSSATNTWGNFIVVQTNTAGTANAAFTDCDYGVYAYNTNATVGFNYMTNVKNSIWAENCPTRELSVTGNILEETYQGITLSKVNSATKARNVLNNWINENSSPSAHIFYGIKHVEPSAFSAAAFTPNIQGNHIWYGRYCIWLDKCNGTTVASNYLYQNNSTSQIDAGVYATNARELQIENNTIEGNSTFTQISTSGKIGLHFVNSYGDLCGNIFDEVNYAMQFEGNCTGLIGLQIIPTRLTTNEINECRYGVVLKDAGLNNQGKIGDQGSEDETHGNIFAGDFNNPAGYRTYCINSDGSNSPFYVFDSDDDDDLSNEEPKFNGTNSAQPPIIKIEATTTVPWSCGINKTSYLENQDSTQEVQQGVLIDIKAFPNPASSTVEITIKGTDSPVLLEVYNLMGQSVFSAIVSGNSSFQVNNFKSGVYLLKFTGSNGAYFNSRLVVLR